MSRKELTPAQRDIFYHLKILNPFGDRFTSFTAKEIAEELELSKRTVSDALKVLYQLGWIDLELVSADFRVCPCASNKFNKSAVQFRSSAVQFPRMEKSPEVMEKSPEVMEKSPEVMEKLTEVMEKLPQTEQIQPLSDIGSKIPQTNKTIKTNKISLSDKEKKYEREKFLEFGMKKVDELPKRPQLPKKWIDKNHDELWAEYQELEQRKEANEQRARESIDQQQETVIDSLIAAALENGEILEIDELYKMFRVQEGWWHWRELDEWRTKRSANQPTNEELLRDKQLIAKAANIPI